MTKRLLLASMIAACGGGKTTPPGAPAAPADPVASAPTAPPATPAAQHATGRPREDLIPRSVLFGNPDRVAVQISPDGKHLSWIAPRDGVLNIWVAPAGKLDEARPVTAEKVRPIRSYTWAYSGAYVLYDQDTAGDENFHVFRTDIATGTSTDLTPFPGARASITRRSPKHPNKLLVEINDRNPQVFDLHEVDLATGKRTLVLQNDDELVGYHIDDDLKVRFADRRLPDGSGEILERTQGKAWKPYLAVPFEDAETTGITGFLPGGKAAYFVETRGRDTAALVALDLATKKSKVLAEDPKADAGTQLVHPTTRAVQAVAFEYDRVRWKVLDKSIQKDLDALAKLDGGEVTIESRTLDDKTWLVMTDSDLHPRRYYLWDRAKQRSTFLFAARPELDKQPLAKMHPIELQARDGLRLVSYLSLPPSTDPDGDGRPTAPVPMVLWVHGGPWARDSWGYDSVTQLLANRGYAVLSVNFRGSTGFGKKFLNAANLQWGKAMHDDLIDAVRWAVASKIAPEDQICIMGGSYGGFSTLAGLTLTPDVFACGVDIVGPSNLLTFMAAIPPYWKPLLGLLKTRVGDPDTAEGKALLTASSPLTHVAKIKRPLLIAQGANDPRVKQAESEQIVAAMKRHGLPVTYALFPDEGHGFARAVNAVAFFAITEAFLSAHLGGFYLPITQDEMSAASMQIVDGKHGIPGLPQ
ncbi:MAG: S9 family peptidase [Kofleriaceae bacterium]